MTMLRAVWFELLKLKIQKKNYVMVGGHLLFLALCYLAFRSAQAEFFSRFEHALSFRFEDIAGYLDGFFFARIAMAPTFLVLMPIVVATLGGDCIAGEMQDGSLKLFVSRPRSRSRIVFSKFLAVYLATTLYCVYFAAVNLAFGCAVLGLQPTQLVIPVMRVFGTDMVIMGIPAALLRYAVTVVYFSFVLTALGAMALFFSAVFDQMSAATVTVISLYFISYVIGALPFSGSLRPWLISEVMNNSFLLWLSPPPLHKLAINFATLGLYAVSFLTLATVIFNCRDLK